MATGGYVTDDRAKILKGLPNIDKIMQDVDKIKAEFKFMADKAGDKPDIKDKDTPDSWVPRNEWMNRLTGIHPFNSEAPVSLLKEHGFLTPATLHYVRNHGIAPPLSWHNHTIDVSGLVNKPMKITMAELVKMPTVSFPVTLQCAGNRRKEQNLIQKGIGFNWGCAAASTAIWTGVPLEVFFKHVGIKSKEEGANFINFWGPEGEVPQGDTTYGASHYREVMLNPTRRCMLAFMMNGELLHPDHGYPVRLLIPGFIGGRMIKWLTKITVTKDEGDNHYHIYDNRVFPKHITSKDEATKHKIWADPAYRIDDRNLNSAIWAPAHCEKVSLSQSTYTVGGYAYNGAGRPIHRVEVTVNDGHTWRPAKIHRFEKPNEFGMVYCWVHWTVEVPVADLRQCTEFAVRAWDDSQNCQPERPTWNLMGMMNNPWFRVKVHDTPDGSAIWFEHPTRVEPSLGHAWDSTIQGKLYLTADNKLPSPGWQERLQKEYSDAYKPLPLEQQPLDGEAYNHRARFLRSETAPGGTPADKPMAPAPPVVKAISFKHLPTVSMAAGKAPIAGKWYVKDVVTPLTMTFDGKQAKSAFGKIEFTGTLRDSPGFEMDVQLGGFPIILEMKEKDGQKILQFSNGGIWSKDAPLKA
jgi:DMSO/TMAO reductase YedYZ molybdopterin-dependent catalytic subunit